MKHSDDIFRQYYGRLRREAIIRSLLWGVAVGFLAAFIAAFVTWMTYFSAGFFVTLGVFFAVAGGVTPVAYLRFFRPTAKDVARRVDALGLEERTVTMLELRESSDYMALCQREDAQRALSGLGMAKFKFAVSLTLILLLSVGGVCAVGMATVTGLSDLGVLPSGAQLIDEARGRDPGNYVEIGYLAADGGYIYGEAEQRIRKGENTQTVIAVADDGYRFYRWTDGYPYPARSDSGSEEIVYTALFLPVDDAASAPSVSGDEATDIPSEDGNASDSEPQEPSGGVEPPNYDYIIDWTQLYKEVFGDYYDAAMEQLSSSDGLSDLLRIFIETYFGTLR